MLTCPFKGFDFTCRHMLFSKRGYKPLPFEIITYFLSDTYKIVTLLVDQVKLDSGIKDVSYVIYNILVNKLLILLNYLNAGAKCLTYIILNITKLLSLRSNIIKEIVKSLYNSNCIGERWFIL